MSNIKKIKVGPNDLRIGNFIYHDESTFVKVTDVAGNLSHRISKFIAKGQILMIAMQQAKKEPAQMRFLENYAIVTFNALSCVPDQQFLLDMNVAAVNCIERHKDVYGIKENISAEEDAKIVEEERELEGALEEVRKDNESNESED